MTAELSTITRPPDPSRGSPHARPWRSACRGRRRESAPRLALKEAIDAVCAAAPTLTGLQPFLALLESGPHRLRLGLIGQCGDLGCQRLGLRVLDVHRHGVKVPALVE